MARRKTNPWPFTSKSLSARNTTPASGGIAAHSKRRAPAKGAKSAPAKSAAARDIDEAKLEAHFKRGGTLAEFLKLNPSDYEAGSNARGLSAAGRARMLKNHIEWVERVERNGRKLSKGELQILRQRFGSAARRSNPVAGDVTDRAHRYRAQKNVTGPRVCVLCGSRRNIDVMHLDGNESNDEPKNLAYGCRSCNATLGAAFKRAGMGRPTNQYNPASNRVPTFSQYAWAVSQGGPNGHHWETGGAHDEAGAVIHATPKSKRIEYARRIADSKGLRSRARLDERWNPGRRGNPATEAAKGYRDFHGEDPSEFVKVQERTHVHEYLSGAGELTRLVVAAIDGKANVTLTGFGGALLTFNEKRNQLFVTGGDQSMDLKAFGIRPAEAHELETLGRVLSLDYATDKKHLGSEGGAAVYRHKLRTTNENGRHVTVKIARYPDLIYRVRDKRLEFSGGSYTIIPEGIDR